MCLFKHWYRYCCKNAVQMCLALQSIQAKPITLQRVGGPHPITLKAFKAKTEVSYQRRNFCLKTVTQKSCVNLQPADLLPYEFQTCHLTIIPQNLLRWTEIDKSIMLVLSQQLNRYGWTDRFVLWRPLLIHYSEISTHLQRASNDFRFNLKCKLQTQFGYVDNLRQKCFLKLKC